MSVILQSKRLTILLIIVILYFLMTIYAMALEVEPPVNASEFLKAIVFMILGSKIEASGRKDNQ